MRNLVALSLVAVLSLSAIADEKPKAKKKKGKQDATQMVAKLVSSLQDVGLSDEQMTTVKATTDKFLASTKEIEEAGLTPEVTSQFAAAVKEAHEEGLKGKQAVNKAKESLTEDQIALMKKMQEETMTMQKTIFGVLTPEQIEALPKPLQRQLQPRKGGKGKGKKKGKKSEEA